MRTAHLFAGVGGGMLADLILGHTPVLAVEQEPYCCDVLRDCIDEGWYPGLAVAETDIREFDFAPWAGRVDCISAGFPCQDISAAGRGAGIHGERSGLFFEVLRAVDAIRPGFVFLENSPNIRTRGRDTVTVELVARGYRWRDGKIGAVDVGAGHRRHRWFCLAANADGLRKLESQRREREQRGRASNGSESIAETDGELVREQSGRRSGSCGEETPEPCGCDQDIANATWERRQEHGTEQPARQWVDGTRREFSPLTARDGQTISAIIEYCGLGQWTPFDGYGGRVVDGLSARGHRVKALGNAQVPLQAAAAWVALTA